MSKKDFKPIYKTEYTSQGSLINEVFPDEVRQILGLIKLLETKEVMAIELTLSWLSANIPPYQKYFRNYDTLKTSLKDCRSDVFKWKAAFGVSPVFPNHLKDKLYNLYEEWWSAYNESGAGIKGGVYIPRETRVRKAIQNL